MTPDELEVLILEGRDDGQLAEAFASLDDKQRSSLSSAAQKIHRQLYRSKADERSSDRLKRFLARRSGDMWQYFQAAETRRARLALYALCPISAVTKGDLFLMHDDVGLLDRIIRDRRPDWIDDWIACELEREFSQLSFAMLRSWIRDGVCRKPEADGYFRLFASYLMRTGNWQDESKPPPLSAQLLDDPDLLEDIDGLFRVENIAFNTNSWLTANAAPHYETWTDALVRLSADGHVDRERLLALALDGLKLDLKQNQLSGFHGFYKRMAPTPAEQLRHQQLYIELLCHPVGHVVKFAIEMLAGIEKQGALDTGQVLREVQAALSGQAKGNAMAALKLTNRILVRTGESDGDALATVCEALRHAQGDVQSAALDILEKHAVHLGEADLSALRDAQAFVSASNRPRLAALLANAASGSSERECASAASGEAGTGLPETDLDYRPISEDLNDHLLLSAEDEIEPIRSSDELIDALLHAVEIVSSPDDVERIVDAVSRLAGDYPEDFEARVSPLLLRLKAGRVGNNSLMIGYVGVGLALLDLIYTWLTGRLHRTPSEHGAYYTPEDAFVPMIARLREIAGRVARGESRPLLSAPTHKGGWIDPSVWLDRLEGHQGDRGLAESMDFRFSLLRLAPDRRSEVLERAAALASPLRRIACYALGGEVLPAKADRSNYAGWISAARCRGPLLDWTAEFASLDLDDIWPDGLRPARYEWHSSHKLHQYENLRWKMPQFAMSVGCEGADAPIEPAGNILARIVKAVSGRISTDWAELPAAALNRQMKDERYWSGDLNTVWVTQWLAQIWPQNPAAAHMKGAARLVQRTDDNGSNWTPGFGYFQALFQRNRPWREPGHLLLCLGLIGKDADSKGLAVDALVEGIDSRLFDPGLFASTMTGLGEGEWIKLNRLGDSLMSVIQVSPLHASVVSEALQQWLPSFDLSQKNAFRLLEVLVEAVALTGRSLGPEARDALRRFGGSGKAAKLARQLASA